MKTNDQIRFIIFHCDEEGRRITDLDTLMDHAGNLVSSPLLCPFLDFLTELKSKGYKFTIREEGDD